MKLVDTGEVLLSGERQYVVTVRDDSIDMNSATAYLNGQAVFTATRVNGSIVDRAGVAIATLPVLVPQSTPIVGRVIWTASDGRAYEASISVP